MYVIPFGSSLITYNLTALTPTACINKAGNYIATLQQYHARKNIKEKSDKNIKVCLLFCLGRQFQG